MRNLTSLLVAHIEALLPLVLLSDVCAGCVREVACFGRDSYEAFLQALVATGFKMPNPQVDTPYFTRSIARDGPEPKPSGTKVCTCSGD